MKKVHIMTRDVMASGDSREVMIDYYSGKILQLKEELNDLTILQHPIQIQTLCSKIMAIKTIISDMRPMALRPSVLLS